MTGNVFIIRHSYKVCKALKSYTVYELEKPHQNTVLTEKIRIEKFRFFSNGSGFDDYLRLRDTAKWETCEQVTGLFKTGNVNLFYGDRIKSGNKSLLIFYFSKNKKRLIIDYYKNFYPKREVLQTLLTNYATSKKVDEANGELFLLSLSTMTK